MIYCNCYIFTALILILQAYGVAWGSTIFLFGASMLLIFDRNKEEIYYREKLYLNQDEENLEIVKS